jgi:hypothetical protein
MPDKLPINLPTATPGVKMVHAVNIDDPTDTPAGTSQKVAVLESSVFRPVYATMAITQRDTNDGSPFTLAVLAHPSGNSTLNPPSAPVVAGAGPFGGYYKVTAFISEGLSKEITVSGSAELVIPSNIVSAVMMAPVAWAGFRHSGNGATVGFVIGIERAGQIIFSQRPTSSKQPNGGDIENVSGGGQVSVLAGDKISAWVASDTAGTVTMGNANFTIHMLDDTTP